MQVLDWLSRIASLVALAVGVYLYMLVTQIENAHEQAHQLMNSAIKKIETEISGKVTRATPAVSSASPSPSEAPTASASPGQ
jgi:hypothetical protein